MLMAATETGLFKKNKKSSTITDFTLVADSVPADSNRIPHISIVDTTKMDSLTKLIYKRNLAVDDSLRLDSINRGKKNGINAPVSYEASDSMTYDAATGLAHLYGNSHVTYEDMDLKSDKIYMSMDSSLVYPLKFPLYL